MLYFLTVVQPGLGLSGEAVASAVREALDFFLIRDGQHQPKVICSRNRWADHGESSQSRSAGPIHAPPIPRDFPVAFAGPGRRR